MSCSARRLFEIGGATLPADYRVLAPIYSAIGMDRFAEAMTPRLIDYAQRSDWMGRRILDLGCGTGASLEWLSRHSYVVVGVDQAPDMLQICQQRLERAGLHSDVREHDLRDVETRLGSFDLALALDVLNELNHLRELELVFGNVHGYLDTGKLFIFDLHTIQGLAGQGLAGDEIVCDEAELAVVADNHFDFERQLFERRYHVFHKAGAHWQRDAGRRVLRGYPAQVVATLLQRSGFSIRHVINTNFEDFEPDSVQADRIIFLVEKQ